MSRPSVVAGLQNSSEALGAAIIADYTLFLARLPAASEVDARLPRLVGNGGPLTLSDLAIAIAGSPEYARPRGEVPVALRVWFAVATTRPYHGDSRGRDARFASRPRGRLVDLVRGGDLPSKGSRAVKMALFVAVVVSVGLAAESGAQEVRRDVAYASPALPRQVLDIDAPPNAKGLPVVFWIHGGGWQMGDKSDVGIKPKAFADRGFVFVSTNYRLLPKVEMETIVGDVAKALRWVHDHIAEHGGDPSRIFVGGHSAGAQLAALICTDGRYLKAEGLEMSILKGCIPVDGDTYDVPAIIETAETRRRVHGQPPATFGHREKFGRTPEKHRDLSAVTHVAKGKPIPPFYLMHVADHPDTSAQAQRLAAVLKSAGIPAQVYAARESTHNKVNADIGLPDDPGTKGLFAFMGEALKR